MGSRPEDPEGEPAAAVSSLSSESSSEGVGGGAVGLSWPGDCNIDFEALINNY